MYKNKAKESVSKVPFQGELLYLMTEKETDISWKSLIYQVPRGAAPDNLERGGVKVGWRAVDSYVHSDTCSSAASSHSTNSSTVVTAVSHIW